jgi:polar amino acid transport system substrate-binding protein
MNIKINKKHLLIWMLSFTFSINATDIGPLYAEDDIRPYLFLENEVIKGSVKEIIVRSFNEANIPLEIIFLPWQRLYKKFRQGKIKVIFPMSKTKERAEEFYFIGPFYRQKIGIYSLISSDFLVKNFSELREKLSSGYAIGVRIDSFEHDILEEMKLTNVFPTYSNNSHYNMLLAGRFGFLSSSNKTIEAYIKSSLQKVQLQFFYYSDCQYIAISKNAPVSTVLSLRNAFHKTIKKLQINELKNQNNCNKFYTSLENKS